MNRIKQLRTEKGLLQSEVAEYIDKSERMVGFYENGKRDPNTDTLIKLSELFNVSVDYILGKSNIRNTDEININEIDIEFANGVKRLTEENKKIAKNIIEGLLAKQKSEENNEEGCK